MILEDKKQLIGIFGASVLTYGVVTHLFSYLRSRSNPFVPVGTVKELYVYPIKSCKGISVFSFYCHELGPVSGEHYDRRLIVVDGKTGRFYTARQKPVMVTIESEIRDGILTVTAGDGSSVQVDLAEVSRNKVVKTAVCILTTVDPSTGTKNSDTQPLKKLREFRLAPEGPMRQQFKDLPIFGVNAAVDQPGYIHVGQTVYARYKKSAF
ncbi:MOSC beta barrel domain protein [Trichostrongylus colubriformis]|uniref:MOSC beta barrel domain protein n=1 Tax=Trichostrongylus colubriformis TaxID=6319 RepID=A0AAN8IFY1_TRICO